jgi:NADH:ubiquinone oxidoreductase subunit E
LYRYKYIDTNISLKGCTAMEIIICMGSSCHSRGNRANVEIARDFIEDNSIEGDVKLSGCLCMDECSRGPVISINGKRYYDVDPLVLTDLLRNELKEK